MYRLKEVAHLANGFWLYTLRTKGINQLNFIKIFGHQNTKDKILSICRQLNDDDKHYLINVLTDKYQ